LLLTRTATDGPELDVVRQFLRSGIGSARPNTRVAVFCEPLLETGYPDVVVVHWQPSRADAWPAARAALTAEDIKLLHFLNGARRVSRDEFGKLSNVRVRERSLDRLTAARVVTVSKRWVRCRPIQEIFAASRIIALEAKVSDWRKGIRQAFLNRWFASESFLLLAKVHEHDRVVEEAQRAGVGVLGATQSLSSPHITPRRDRLPQSYASWLFNEWAWRGFGLQAS